MKFTVGRARIEFDPGGYVRLRAWDSRASCDRFVYLQRLTAFAHGELSSPFVDGDPRHAHHLDRDGWNNQPSNLEARDPEGHGREHRVEQLQAD